MAYKIIGNLEEPTLGWLPGILPCAQHHTASAMLAEELSPRVQEGATLGNCWLKSHHACATAQSSKTNVYSLLFPLLNSVLNHSLPGVPLIVRIKITCSSLAARECKTLRFWTSSMSSLGGPLQDSATLHQLLRLLVAGIFLLSLSLGIAVSWRELPHARSGSLPGAHCM